MNHERPAEDRIGAWLQGEAPGQLPDRVLQATFDRTRTDRQRQRPGWGIRWRNRPMSLSARIITAAAAVLLAVVGIGIVGRGFDSGIGGPQLPPSETPTPTSTGSGPTFGVTFQGPAGWEIVTDEPDWFYLAAPDGAATKQGIHILRGAAIPASDTGCTGRPDPVRGRTVNDFADYVAAHPNFERSQTHDVTIAGRSGATSDLTLIGSSSNPCQFVNGVVFLAQEVGDSWSEWGLWSGEHQRVAFLDDGAGGVIVVAVVARGETTFDLMTTDAAPIIESLRFQSPP